MKMTMPAGAVARARAVLAAHGPMPDDAVILEALEAALRQPAPGPAKLPPGTPRRYLTRDQLKQVGCPRCDARPGRPCLGETGRPRGPVHVERQKRALEELPEQPGEARRAEYYTKAG
jgi:hypothetical protein